MITQNNLKKEQYSDDSQMPPQEENTSEFENKFKEYGKKSLSPLVNLLDRYKADIIPYSSSIVRALDGAINTLSTSEGENAQADQTVAGWFRDGREWFNGTTEQLQNGNPKEILDYLEAQAQKNPGLMFSASYAVGLIFGRVGRYWAHTKNSDSDPIH
jgi:hypothetical protein